MGEVEVVRLRLGCALALVVALGTVIAPTSTAAASCSSNADTTWVDPIDTGRSDSWSEPLNWTNGVPDATSRVCIEFSEISPRVPGDGDARADVIDAAHATVVLDGVLTVSTRMSVAELSGDGRLAGPGVVSVTRAVATSDLELRGAVTVNLLDSARLGGDLDVWDDSSLNILGDVQLEPGTRITTEGQRDGLFTVTPSGSLRLDAPTSAASVHGPFENHGEVEVLAGRLTLVDMLGGTPFSTGSFSAKPPAILDVSGLELRTGARIEHAAAAMYLTVPVDNSITVADSLLYAESRSRGHTVSGEGEVVLTEGTRVGGSVGGSLTMTIPSGEAVRIGEASFEDSTRLRVLGELAQTNSIYLEDDSVIDVYGVHRAGPRGGFVGYGSDDPGLEVVHPGARFESSADGVLGVYAPFVNHGTVRSAGRFVGIVPFVSSPEPSTGTFRSEPGSEGVFLGSDRVGDAALELAGAALEGAVGVSGAVHARDLTVRGAVTTLPPADDGYRAGRVDLDGTTTLTDGASLTGDVRVAGRLDSDPGPTGATGLDGVEVTGAVRVLSGTLDLPTLGRSTLSEDGTLRSGSWSAAPDARLQLPKITTNQAALNWEGRGATIGGLGTVTNGVGGTMDLRDGADLSLPGRLRNEGTLRLSSGSVLDTDAAFRQTSTGRLSVAVGAAGSGRVRTAGRRDLAGDLVVRRDPAYKPRVGSLWTILTSPFRAGDTAAFDRVVSPRFDDRRIRARYGATRVRLEVDRVR